MRIHLLLAALFSVLALSGCTTDRGEIGSEKNPIKLFFVPSVDAKVLEDNSKKFEEYLEKNTPYKFSVSVPQSYIAVVESFGTKRADVALINSSGYYKANKKYGAEARLTVLRNGAATYQAQFIARADGPIKTLKDLEGKKIAYVDPTSASGYLLPLKVLRDRKITPKDFMFAQKHDNVVSMVYQGQVDAGATFYSPRTPEGKIDDARRMVLTQYPDVEQKVKIVELTDPIINDPIIFRKELPEEVKTKIADAFLKFVETEEGKDAFKAIYGVTGLKKANDADYDVIREMFAMIEESDANVKK